MRSTTITDAQIAELCSAFAGLAAEPHVVGLAELALASTESARTTLALKPQRQKQARKALSKLRDEHSKTLNSVLAHLGYTTVNLSILIPVRVRFKRDGAGWAYFVLAFDSLACLEQGWSAGRKRDAVQTFETSARQHGWYVPNQKRAAV